MPKKQYYKFSEHNSWEGETWHFFLLLDDLQWRQINHAITGLFKRMYEIAETPTPRKEIDALVKNSDFGYMNFYNKVSKVELPAEIDLDKEDIFYKGGCWKKDR
jgi:hypothetical protein